MAKMKVHELAKELNVQSKDIISLLQGKGIEVKAAQSSIEDEAIAIVKKTYGAVTPVAEKAPVKEEASTAEKASAPKVEAPAAKEEAPVPKQQASAGRGEEAPKKKKRKAQ